MGSIRQGLGHQPVGLAPRPSCSFRPEVHVSKELALKFLHEAETDPVLRPQLEALDPRETARLLQSLAGIANQAGYSLTTKDLQAALREWAGEMLDDSELARLA